MKAFLYPVTISIFTTNNLILEILKCSLEHLNLYLDFPVSFIQHIRIMNIVNNWLQICLKHIGLSLQSNVKAILCTKNATRRQEDKSYKRQQSIP